MKSVSIALFGICLLVACGPDTTDRPPTGTIDIAGVPEFYDASADADADAAETSIDEFDGGTDE